MAKKSWIQEPSKPLEVTRLENLQVIFEDNHVIAINKRNSDIIQADKTKDTVLCDIVKEYIKIKYNKPGEAFLGTVHRLDRPVSGIVLYAKTGKALSRLTQAFKERTVHKTYWAVVKGDLPKEEDTVINYLWKDEKQNKTYSFDKPGPGRKESELSYKVIGKGDHYTFVEVYPKTGRHHQIRATLSWLGCPIKGDIKYGSKRTNDNASIHLHAREISFPHPVQKTPTVLTVMPPEDPLWDAFLEVHYRAKLR
jgi:23S rRNA pseudouridine1911/1915/1917 synthase